MVVPVHPGRWPRSGVRGPKSEPTKEQAMSLGTILLIVVILMLVGVLPVWPHARSWGYAPGGAIGVVLLILIILLLTGRL
jgi:membrane-bound ClpP family serine protease